MFFDYPLFTFFDYPLYMIFDYLTWFPEEDHGLINVFIQLRIDLSEVILSTNVHLATSIGKRLVSLSLTFKGS